VVFLFLGICFFVLGGGFLVGVGGVVFGGRGFLFEFCSRSHDTIPPRFFFRFSFGGFHFENGDGCLVFFTLIRNSWAVIPLFD